MSHTRRVTASAPDLPNLKFRLFCPVAFRFSIPVFRFPLDLRFQTFASYLNYSSFSHKNIADSSSLTFSLSVGPAILLQFSYSFHRKNLQSVLSTFALWPSSFGEDRRRHENLIACKYAPGAHNLFPDTSNNVLRCKQCFFRSFSLFQRCQFA